VNKKRRNDNDMICAKRENCVSYYLKTYADDKNFFKSQFSDKKSKKSHSYYFGDLPQSHGRHYRIFGKSDVLEIRRYAYDIKSVQQRYDAYEQCDSNDPVFKKNPDGFDRQYPCGFREENFRLWDRKAINSCYE
jgi:hypothetical protein